MNFFRCKQCGACCKQPGYVYLKEADAERLSAALGMDVYAFTEIYCVLLDRKHLALKKHADETCLFLRAEGCSVYESRPVQCRDFPHGWKTERSLEYCPGLKPG